MAPFIGNSYFIPLEYMAPDLFFEKLNEPDGMQTVYWKRSCSLYDYYVMLSKDNPEFKPIRSVQSTQSRSNPNPRDYRPRPIAHNPYISGDKAPSDKWGKGLMPSTQGSSGVTAWKDRNNGLMGETSPSTPTIRNAAMTRNAPLSDMIRFKEQKISSLSQEQQHAA